MTLSLQSRRRRVYEVRLEYPCPSINYQNCSIVVTEEPISTPQLQHVSRCSVTSERKTGHLFLFIKKSIF